MDDKQLAWISGVVRQQGWNMMVKFSRLLAKIEQCRDEHGGLHIRAYLRGEFKGARVELSQGEDLCHFRASQKAATPRE